MSNKNLYLKDPNSCKAPFQIEIAKELNFELKAMVDKDAEVPYTKQKRKFLSPFRSFNLSSLNFLLMLLDISKLLSRLSLVNMKFHNSELSSCFFGEQHIM